MAADIHAVGAADAVFVIRTVHRAAIDRKTRTGMFGGVAVAVMFGKIPAAGLFRRMGAGAVHLDVTQTAAVILIMDTIGCNAG